MKKRITLLFLTLLGCYFSFGAERVAPAFPEFVSLQDGEDYYLYNVGTKTFFSIEETNSNAIWSDTGIRLKISSTVNGAYSIQNTSDNTFLSRRSYGDLCRFESGYSESNCSWNISSSYDGAYRINMIPGGSYYRDGEYFGYREGYEHLCANCTEDESGSSIEWKLIDGDTGDMYCARLRLFKALEAMNGKPYNIDKFEKIYADTESSIEELNNAATVLNNSSKMTLAYQFPDWNDYPILLEPSLDGRWYNSSENQVEANVPENETSTFSTTIVTDQDATFCCYHLGFDNATLSLKVNGKEIRHFNANQLGTKRGFFYELPIGKNVIEWTVSNGHIIISDIGIEKTPLISADLLEPGSLGTEILYYVDHVKEIRRLKIKGNMNDDDWRIIEMMKGNLFTLDLTETNVNIITKERFNNAAVWPFLHVVLLPEGLETIEDEAFAKSNVDSINFPSTLVNIGSNAFYHTNIRKAFLPESCLNLGNGIFNYCTLLEDVSISDKLKEIPSAMFYNCCGLKTFQLPSQLTTVNNSAFNNCVLTAFELPESLTTIGSSAFRNTNQNGEKDKLIIPKNVVSIEAYAFADCTQYTSAELPVGYYNVNGIGILPTSIKTLRLNCPTVVKHPSAIIDDNVKQNVTLQVPSFLVNSYKLDEYWYEFAAIEGFETDEINEWVLNSDLVLGARERLAGTPNIKINSIGSLKINGTDGMSINDLTIEIDPDNNVYGRIFSNADGVTTNGNLWMDFRAGTSNKWYFLSLPYNVKVSEIIFTNNNPRRAIRYYDGANRAANGASGSWKNFAEDDIIPAGTGFIFQVSEGGWWRIPTQVDESKEYLTSNKMFVKALAENNSNNASDKGWNLVGNPYQCWYNIHKLNFTAPITVRENDNYAAYSVIDDDYAIAPNQAFFVQCPEGIHEISFPLDGRQMTSVIESQTGIKPFDPASSNARLLTDITVSNGNHSDRTRIVLNSHASTGYESNCDASKFLTEVPEVPQIYSYDNECQYAINERPQADGLVHLGFIAGESGHYTLSLTRNASEHVWLTDLENGQTIDLTTQDYGFTSEAGTFNERFELRFTGNTTYIQSQERQTFNVTAVIGGIEISGISGNVGVYNMAGVQVAEQKLSGTSTFIALPKGVYVVKNSQTKIKVIVL